MTIILVGAAVAMLTVVVAGLFELIGCLAETFGSDGQDDE